MISHLNLTAFLFYPWMLFFSLDNNDLMHSQTFASDLELGLDFAENSDLQITFDDLDNLCIPFEIEDFALPDRYNPNNN